MINKLFSSILIFLLCLGIFAIFGHQKNYSSLERRYLKTNNDIVLSDVYNGDFLSKIDDILKDQIIFRDMSLQFYYSNKIDLLNTVSNIMISYNDDVVSLGDEYLIFPIIKDLDKDIVQNKAFNIKAISDLYPDIKMYQYFPTRIEETNFLNLDNKTYSKIFPLRDIYLANLGENITTSSLKLNSIDDHKKYYYKTDHHWNAEGSYQGYNDIINMIFKDFPEIGNPLPINKTLKLDHKFKGSFSTKIAKIGGYDYLTDFETNNIIEYEYYVNGHKMSEDDIKSNYFNNIENELYHDYDLYFGENAFERVYKCNNDKPNLLIFSDSFINPIKDDIAKHFNNTIILDMRSQPDNFSLNKYIYNYDVDIILFLYMYDSLYTNGNLFIPVD